VVNRGDDLLHAESGDIVEIEYIDQHHMAGDLERQVLARAEVLQERDTEVNVVQTEVRERIEKIKKQLGIAESLLNLGKIFKELGLHDRAGRRFEEALRALDTIAAIRGAYPVELKEKMYYLRWQIQVAGGNLTQAAATCSALLRDFPMSEYAETALIQLGELCVEDERYTEAVAFYDRLLAIPRSVLHAEAQFKKALAYEKMPNGGPRALQEHLRCANEYQDSPYAAESILRVASFYLNNEEYGRAIEMFEKYLNDNPDAEKTPYILLHYGRCLYRKGKGSWCEAIDKWRQIVRDYPESDEAKKANRYIEVVAPKAGC
jgi:TolA-binding protein